MWWSAVVDPVTSLYARSSLLLVYRERNGDPGSKGQDPEPAGPDPDPEQDLSV